MNSRHVLALVLMAGLAVGIGANPRFIEELKIGGGYDDPADGGADFEKDGDIITSGTIVPGDANVTTVTINGTSYTPRLLVNTEEGNSDVVSDVRLRNSDTTIEGARSHYARSRGSIGSEALVQSGDQILEITGLSFDGIDYEGSAAIRMQSSTTSTPGSDDTPGEIDFLTTPDGSKSLALRLRIGDDGDFDFQSNRMQDALINDADVFVVDNADVTKQLAFQVSPIATGTTRTLTMPDQNIDLSPVTGDFQGSDTELGEIAAISGTKGDVLVYNGASWVDLPVGSDGQQLEADSTHAAGLKWASAGGSGTHPVGDATSIVEGSIDTTKEIRLELDTHVASGTTRVWTVANRDVDFATDVGFLDAAQEWTAAQTFDASVLTDAVNIAWDVSTNQVASVTLAGNRTLDNPTNLRDGGTYIVIVRQDATGSRTLAFGSAYKWPAGSTPVLSTGANDVDVLTFVSDGTNMYGVAVRDFS